MTELTAEFGRPCFVSVWVGEFPTPAAADAYFTEEYEHPEGGEPIWSPSPFQRELGLGFYPPWHLEIQFPDPPRRTPAELLTDATFAETFSPLAIEVAAAKGVADAAGLACVFHFDYTLKPGWAEMVGPVRFLGAFPFVYREPSVAKQVARVAESTGLSAAALQTVLGLARDCSRERTLEPTAHTAREFCGFILTRVPQVGRLLRIHGLQTSEAVGRVVTALVDAELMRKSPGESEADFAGLFDLRGSEGRG